MPEDVKTNFISREAESPQLSLKEQLQQRVEQLELSRKQIEAQYIEVSGMLSEAKRTLTLISQSDKL